MVLKIHSRVPQLFGPDVTCVMLHSLRGIWSYLRANEVFFTHGLLGSGKPPRDKVVVNLWHGMPIKRIGTALGSDPVYSTYALATSQMYAEIIAQCFGIPQEDVLVVGLPRNDRMIAASQEREHNAIPRGVWLPTFRTGDAVSDDGNEHYNPFQLPNATESRIDAMLQQLGIECWLKPHPLSRQYMTYSGTALQIVDPAANDSISLYQRLGRSDFLITDFSSVWIDYLLLDKPIVFCVSDMKEYVATRGTFLSRLGFDLPGPMATTVDELRDALADIAQGRDSHAAARAKVRDACHLYCDGKSTERLLAELEKRSAEMKPGQVIATT